MNRMLSRVAGVAAVLLSPAVAWSQPFEAVGTRAAGLGGAYVAVADDASAAYWNPAGFATGSYFSLVLDRAGAKVSPDQGDRAGSRTGTLIALGAPMLGLSYYRLRSTTVSPNDEPSSGRNIPADAVRVDTLTTHQTGATLVQSVVQWLDVGATLKLVRGIASSVVAPNVDRDSLLDEGSDLVGKASNKFDADIGVMARVGRLKAGLTVRNVSEPSFEAAGNAAALKLQRQARAGVAITPMPGLLVAADLDLLTTQGPLGDTRTLAFGGEGRVMRRGFVRGGLQFNTASGSNAGGAPAVSLGASYAIKASVLLDTQVTGGHDTIARGWGISARFVY